MLSHRNWGRMYRLLLGTFFIAGLITLWLAPAGKAQGHGTGTHVKQVHGSKDSPPNSSSMML